MTTTTNVPTLAPPRRVIVERLGRVPYLEAEAWQHAAAEAVRAGEHERVALLEHPPVITLGARADRAHVLASSAELQARGVAVVDADRGGDVTFHGPGQLVAYPILDLRTRGLHAADYVRALERVAVETLAAFGIEAGHRPGTPGVWVRDWKIAAVGVRIDRGISRHGLALNVDIDLEWFDLIVPCGLEGLFVTSMAAELDETPSMGAVIEAFVGAFGRVFETEVAR
ncbi:MAG: lipoyl(octanoyl) transferase LipB [Dehalococcoidia bacterium]